MYGKFWRIMYLFQFLSTMRAKVAISNPLNYIFLRLAINILSIELVKSIFPKFKNWAGMPTFSIFMHIAAILLVAGVQTVKEALLRLHNYWYNNV